MKNRTRGTVFTTKLPFATPDLTSAEWIAEAPSDCSSYRCRPIPLSNFGSVSFTKIAALGNGIGGTLTANPGWTTTAISARPGRVARLLPRARTGSPGFASSTAGALPGDASSDGRGFSVQWSADAGDSNLLAALRRRCFSSRRVFYLSYLRSELLRRKGRTILTLAGLAIGVALVIVISSLTHGPRQRAEERRSTRSRASAPT